MSGLESRVSIVDYIIDIANHSPETLAIICGNSKLTYRELINNAINIALDLQGLELLNEEPIAVCAGRCLEFVVGALGIMLAGGAYTPIDPTQPSAHLQSLLNKAKIRIVIGPANNLTPFKGMMPYLLPVNLRAPIVTTNFRTKLNGNNLAYQLFTSGSTGTQKVVAIEHQSVCALLDGFDLVAPPRRTVISTSLCPFSFDVSVWELFSALTRGGTVHILDANVAKHPANLARYIIMNKITTSYIPPFLLDHVINELCRYGSTGDLERILVGVEPIMQSTLQKLRDLSSDLVIINGYGPTETTICATFYPFKQAYNPDQRTPIGWPVHGWSIDIVDQNLNSLPIGEIGEIIIGGIGLARGYASDPEETRKRFIEKSGMGRWYRTGDLGRVLLSNAIEFIGRNDEQVKIRGFRIDLTEIEATLLRHPEVQSALVLAPTGPHGRRLIAFVKSCSQPGKLQQYLIDSLPSYMVPSRLITVGEFPLTDNGKIDRRKLLDMIRLRPLSTPINPATSELEEKWAGIWADVLNVDIVGIKDNFFELGGDSVLALIAARRMAEVCKAPELSTLFLRYPTISQATAAYNNTTSSPQFPNLQMIEEDLPVPVSFGQEGLWTLQQLDINNAALVIPIAFKILGTISDQILIQALNVLVQRHEAFRLSYKIVENKLQQFFSSNLHEIVCEPIVVTTESLKSEISRIFSEDVKTVLSSNAPPVLMRIIRINDNEAVVLITIHHIAVDGTSLPIIASDLADIFNGRTLDKKQHGPRFFATQQHALFESSLWEADLNYWKNIISQLPEALDLPIDNPRLVRRSGRGRRIDQTLSIKANEGLKILANKYATTSFGVVISLIGLLAHRLSGQDDFFVATAVSIRPLDINFDDAIGYFVNLLPLRLRFDREQNIREFIKGIENQIRESQAHANFPFEKMLADLPERGQQHHAFFTRLVVAQEIDSKLPYCTSSCEIHEFPVDSSAAMYELTIFISEKNGKSRLQWEYDADIFTADTIQRFQQAFNTLLTSIIEMPDIPIGEVELLSEFEREKILSQIHNMELPPNLNYSIVTLFDDQVNLQPEAMALEKKSSSISYKELFNLSYTIAHHLTVAGVCNKTPVIIFAERSFNFISSILGILRAGGYYIPIDERVPLERIKFICETVGARYAIGDRKLENYIPDLKIFGYNDFPLITERLIDISKRSPEDLAYVMFTSGSTGQPKGVAIPDCAVVRLVREQNFVQFNKDDKFALISNLAFDAATLEIWGALLNGGCLVIPNEEEIRNPRDILTLIYRTGVTAGFFNVTFFRQMINIDPVALQGMHTILVGGENVPDSLLVQAAKKINYNCLVNGYGPTENTTFSCCYRLQKPPILGRPIPIGRAIAHSAALVVDEKLRPVPIGVVGEILVGGKGLARGYIGNKEETEKRFIIAHGNLRWYRTGDLGRLLPSGDIEYIGRRDDQVKVRGFRIEIGEIEAVCMRIATVRAAAVIVTEIEGVHRLEAYVETEASSEDLKHQLIQLLPDYMVPSLIITVKSLPLNANGKIDRSALLALRKIRPKDNNFVAPSDTLEAQLTDIYKEILQVDAISIYDRFFDIGGNSLLLIILAERINQKFKQPIRAVDLLDRPTIAEFAKFLSSKLQGNKENHIDDILLNKERSGSIANSNKIAIIGMAGRFPGAPDLTTFWAHSIAGEIDIRTLPQQKEGYISRRGVLDEIDKFDANYFGISEREAKFMDPQQRVLLEVAQHALDDAAIDPNREQFVISVYAACGPSEQLDISDTLSEQYEQSLARAPDFAATRISYRLNLRGESITVQTGCSSSLVAVHLACQSLLSGKSNIALAGGTSFAVNQDFGYSTEDGMITSPSGICRPFDTSADGTVPGGGSAMIVLMRLEDALEGGHNIRAVICSSALNNDGATKVGFMAPSPTGQADVIIEAHKTARINAGSIAYIETHGTATQLGDAVEIEGLLRAFERDPERSLPCALGSVKANCGHLDRAAGVTGLIRAALAVEHGIIPPMAGFQEPNPTLALNKAAFYVPREACSWPKAFAHRRAGVSSFGVGGTNAHIILEEAPIRAQSKLHDNNNTFLLPLSGHTPEIIKMQASLISDAIKSFKDADLPSIVRTLASGRRVERHRAAITATTIIEAVQKLKSINVTTVNNSVQLVMAFPGQGDPSVAGFRELYDKEIVYRNTLDNCAEIIINYAGFDIREDLFTREKLFDRFSDMGRFQPAMFSVQWALIELWQSWGVKPRALLGHSLGEVVAATRAGIFQINDALKFVTVRGRLMQKTTPGAMLSVPMSPEWVEERLMPGTSIAAINGKELVVISGLIEPINELEEQFRNEGVPASPLAINRAAHGPFMKDAAKHLTSFLETIPLQSPQIPILSNLTGAWGGTEMTLPDYWSKHIINPVQFSSSLRHLATNKFSPILIVGPGEGLQRLMLLELDDSMNKIIHPDTIQANNEREAMLEALGELWVNGVSVDLLAPLGRPLPLKISLPPTVFDHQRVWPTKNESPVSKTFNEEIVTKRMEDPAAWIWSIGLPNVFNELPIKFPIKCLSIGAVSSIRDEFEQTARNANLIITSQYGIPDQSIFLGITDVIWWPTTDESDLLEQAGFLATQASLYLTRVWICIHASSKAQAYNFPSTQALGHAAVRVAPLEYPGSKWHLVNLCTSDVPRICQGLVELLKNPNPPTILNLEKEKITSIEFKRVWPHWNARPLRVNGCYVISGGAGRVARALAQAIAKEIPANIILLGRKSAEAVKENIHELTIKLKLSGTNIIYQQVDITNIDEVRSCFTNLKLHYNRIDGIIHAAGFTDTSQFKFLASTNIETIKRIANSKLAGTLAIAEVLEDTDADFIILCSSLSTVLGGIGFGAYVAANAELDNYARRRWEMGDYRWISVGWDAWTNEHTSTETGPSLYALNDNDGYEIMRRLLSCHHPVVIISTGDIKKRQQEVYSQITGIINKDSHEPIISLSHHTDPSKLVVEVLNEVMGRLPSDPNLDLRDEGIESLTILQIVTRLRKRLGIKIALADAMKTLSLAGLQKLVKQNMNIEQKEGGHVFEIVQAPLAEMYLTSSTQRRWLELMPEKYGGLDIVIEVCGPSTIEALADAVRQVIQNHSILRTRFIRNGNTWAQILDSRIVVTEVDFSQLTQIQQLVSMRDLVDQNARKWFNVNKSSPFEVTVIGLGAERNALIIHAHHVVFDGWSSSLFIRDIDRIVSGRFHKPSLQYLDFAVSQSQYIQSSAILPVRNFWKHHFDGASPPTRLPSSREDSPNNDRGEVLMFKIEPEIMENIRMRARQYHTTPFALFFAIYGILIHEMTRSFDLTLGTTIAGRPTPSAENIIGVFVNPLPLRIKMEKDDSFHSYISRIQQVLIGLHEHQNYPIEDLIKHVDPFIGCGLNDTFHCYLLYQNYWKPDTLKLKFKRLDVGAVEHHKLMREFEIILEDSEGALSGELWYRPSRFSIKTMEYCKVRFITLVKLIASIDFNESVFQHVTKDFLEDTVSPGDHASSLAQVFD